jgi:1-Cys peroxiredoxin 6
MPGITLGDTIPNIEADSTIGHLKLYDYVGNHWAIIFSHPGMNKFD